MLNLIMCTFYLRANENSIGYLCSVLIRIKFYIMYSYFYGDISKSQALIIRSAYRKSCWTALNCWNFPLAT